jgi:dipeptidyl aminopeptidase/acylaminoacyl peptidase
VMVVVTAWIDTAGISGNEVISARGNYAETDIISATTGKAFRVFAGQRKITQATFGYFGHATLAGHPYGYFGGQTLTGSGAAMADFDSQHFTPEHGHVDLYQVDLDSGATHVVQAGDDKHQTSWVVDPQGHVVARDDYDPLLGVHRVFVSSPTPSLVLHDPNGEDGLMSLGRTPDSVLVHVTDAQTGDWRLVEYRAGVAGQGVAPFGDEHIRDLLYDSQGLLMGGITTADQPRSILFDPARQARFDAAARPFKGETLYLTSTTDNLDKLVIRTEGDADSGTYFLVDMAAHKAAALAWAYPSILQDAVGSTRMVHYKAADGLALDGVLTLPPGREPKNLPVVVMPHGGPQARDYPHFDWWAQAFASRGYAVFQPNFRGSDGYGLGFRNAGFGQWGRKMQTDVSDGLADLARQGIVDPKRACIVGASYGGYVALAGVTLQHGLYRCAVADAPVSDLTMMVNLAEDTSGATNSEARYWHSYMGVKDAGDPILKTLSPARHAADADAPILLIHGKQDTTVPPEQSAVMRRALNSAGKPVEFVEMAGEDHYLSNAATRTQMLEAAVAFVEKYDPPN